jgi:hypothetical protein
MYSPTISRSEYERLRKEAHKDPRYLQSYLRMTETQHRAKMTMSSLEEFKLILNQTTEKHKKFEAHLIEEIKEIESKRGVSLSAKPFVPKENFKKLFNGIVFKNEKITPEHFAQNKYDEEMAAKCHCLTDMMQVECMQQMEKTGKCIYGPYKFY